MEDWSGFAILFGTVGSWFEARTVSLGDSVWVDISHVCVPIVFVLVRTDAYVPRGSTLGAVSKTILRASP